MSAFICTPEHIAAIATARMGKNLSLYIPGEGWKEFTPAAVAVELMKENIRSVTNRYPDDEDGERPGPQMFDADLIEEARVLSWNTKYSKPLDPVHVLKLCHSL